jgi:3-dehydroquinate synthase
MIKKIRVPLKKDAYDIVVGKDILGDIGKYLKSCKLGKDAIIITNPIVRKLHGKKLLKGLGQYEFCPKIFEVPDGEKSKSAETAFSLIKKIAEYDVYRKPFIVAFGGGVTGDLAGFVAAIYKRGIPYVQIPTTLLAQVDSSIGGKVAVDLAAGKNLAGAFYQPKAVLSDIDLLATLDRRQILNGMSEVIKYGIISDKELFEFIAGHKEDIIGGDARSLQHIIAVCSKIKADVVAEDEHETKGLRTILNCGHTVGHAIEAADGYACYHHGEAVALGLRIAADIAVRKGMLNESSRLKIENVLSDYGLPDSIRHLKLSDIMERMKHDKKFISGKNRFVLPERLGKVKIVEGVEMDLIKTAIKKYIK